MKITTDFIRGNPQIQILSNNGVATPIPEAWKPILTGCDMLVVIPDMHMYIYSSHQDNFKYGAKAMLGLLGHLTKLKEDLDDDDKLLRIYQLGDFYESRFPSLKGAGNATPAEITTSNNDYAMIESMMTSLRTFMLYGNHDFEMRHFPDFRFGAYEGRVYIEHGFTPDTWSQFSNPNAPLWEPAQLAFKLLRDVEAFFTNLRVADGDIKEDEHIAIGVTSGAVERGDYPSESDYLKNYSKQRDYYSQRLLNDPDKVNARICIIGHTHHPFFGPFTDPNKPNEHYLFLDAGAWTEGRSDFAVVTDEEVALCRYRRTAPPAGNIA